MDFANTTDVEVEYTNCKGPSSSGGGVDTLEPNPQRKHRKIKSMRGIKTRPYPRAWRSKVPVTADHGDVEKSTQNPHGSYNQTPRFSPRLCGSRTRLTLDHLQTKY